MDFFVPQTAPSEDWRKFPEVPVSSEMMALGCELPHNPIDHTYTSKESYLQTQYALYRFEGTESLRKAIRRFKADPNSMERDDVYIYTQVYVTGMHLSNAVAHRLCFSTARSPTKIKWRQSDRLTPGTLVALSPDNFTRRCYFATVAARDLSGGLEPNTNAGEDEYTPPRIDITWSCNAEAVLVDPNIEMVMVEASSGYFEAVRHALRGLQLSASYPSRFDKYIIHGCQERNTAAYLDEISLSEPRSISSLDHSQREAFRNMTSHELAITQGPPGTGKTFTSVTVLESLVESMKQCSSSRAPVVIAAQTNHAVDQLLRRCMQLGINVVRLGGRSQEDVIIEQSVYNLRKKSKFAVTNLQLYRDRRQILVRIKAATKALFPPGLISHNTLRQYGLLTHKQHQSLEEDDWESASTYTDADADESDNCMARWLDTGSEEFKGYAYVPPQGQNDPVNQEERPRGRDHEPEEEEDRPHGSFLPMKQAWTGAVPNDQQESAYWKQAEQLARCPDLFKVKPAQRGILYRYWNKQLLDKITSEVSKLLEEYSQASNRLKASRWANNVEVFQQEGIQIIACTTTGLTKYRGLLEAVGPRVLLVEEAAETREAILTSALIPSLEQLILVGDHQQLPPSVDVRLLGGAPYNLNVSLFQRLVGLGVPYSALQVQRRMIPAIREIVHTFYPRLEDHDVVKTHPPVAGMGGENLWWFQHDWPETRIDHSYQNYKEADMVVGFAKYLVQHGLQPSQITILTYYSGQVKTMQRVLRHAGLADLDGAVRTVDGFQGEENDIIILSLVRSPGLQSRGIAKAGFVEDENRAVVATSRAKCGFYIFGNAKNLLASSQKSKQTWQKVFNVFKNQKRTGFQLPIDCKGPGKVMQMRFPANWNLVLAAKQQLCQACGVQPPPAPVMADKSGHDAKSKQRPTPTSTSQDVLISRAKEISNLRTRDGDGRKALLPPASQGDGADDGLTSDQLIVNGYFSMDSQSAEVMRDNGQALIDTATDISDVGIAERCDVGIAERCDADDGDDLRSWSTWQHSEAAPSSPKTSAVPSPHKAKSLREKWKPEVLAENDAALCRALNEESSKPGQSSTSIREVYQQTQTDAAGYRELAGGGVVQTQYQHIVALAPDIDTTSEQTVGVELSGGVRDRKRQLADDASGLGIHGLLPSGERGATGQGQGREKPATGVLIEFD